MIQQQLNELWLQTRALALSSSKYCSFTDAMAQNGSVLFLCLGSMLLIFYLFGILCSFLIIIVNGKNVLSWCVSFGTFFFVAAAFLPRSDIFRFAVGSIQRNEYNFVLHTAIIIIPFDVPTRTPASSFFFFSVHL